MAEQGKGFWQSAPGIITAVAALVTALGGLLGILVQAGVIGGDDEAARPPASVGSSRGDVGQPAAASTSTTSGSGAAPTSAGGDLVPFDRATATLTRRNGSTTDVLAPTVGLACDTGRVAFTNGQKVSLDLVRSITYDTIYPENASATGAVTLLDGRRLTDPIYTWNCPVTGRNDLGAVEVKLDVIRRIDFRR